MSWLDRFRRAPAEPERLTLPLFPLNTVLFPGGRQPLKIFEQRYLDMAAACLKADSPFGICLIAEGKEVGESAVPHPVGTLAKVSDWDMPQLGILLITALGQQRFRVIESWSEKDHLLMARVEVMADPPVSLPPERQRLLPLLHKILDDHPTPLAEPRPENDAAWVGYRLTEVLPVQNLAKQKLLELDDPLSRLEILERFLDQRQLLG